MTLNFLIADDNAEEAQLLALAVRMRWIDAQVTVVGEVTATLKQFDEVNPNALVIGLSATQNDVCDICKYVRERSRAPILVLTSAGAILERIRPLDSGADDCLSRPFDTLEMLARLSALIRRSSLTQGAYGKSWRTGQVGYAEDRWQADGAWTQVERARTFISGSLVLDTARREVQLEGRVVRFTSTEYKLLEVLLRQKGSVLSHRYLLEQVWGPEYTGEDHYLKVFVRRLRQKLGDCSGQPRFIGTEWGRGYWFIPAK